MNKAVTFQSSMKYGLIMDEGGHPIINKDQILVCNTETQDVIYVPFTEDIAKEFGLVSKADCENEFLEDVSESPSGNENEDTKIWTTENTLFLIDCVKTFDKQFASGIKKNVWQKVAEACQHLHKKLTAKHCEIKWKSLLRTYKSVLLNNNTSGQKKRYWEFYEIIHSIMFKKPEITPPATCSSSSGLKIKQDSVKEPHKEMLDDMKGETLEKQENEKPDFESSFSKKRKQKVSEAEKRHKEKMQRLDRFNDLFQEMINKMPEKS